VNLDDRIAGAALREIDAIEGRLSRAVDADLVDGGHESSFMLW
jgi:hypothetical protein